jgi:hypothetical protein
MKTTEDLCRTGTYQVLNLKVADWPDWDIQARASLDAPTSMPRGGISKVELVGFEPYAVVGVPIDGRLKMEAA